MASELYYFKPSTPPRVLMSDAELLGSAHSRTTSGSSEYASSSAYTDDSSPASRSTSVSTSSRSPGRRPPGPILLPKIRPQDIVVEPQSHYGPQRSRKALSTTQNPPGFAPYPASRPSISRRAVEPIDCSLVSPVCATPTSYGYPGSSAMSPLSAVPPSSSRRRASHSRNPSVSSIDDATLSRYGYPTYRQIPRYLSQCSPTTPASATSFTYPTPTYPTTPYTATAGDPLVSYLAPNYSTPAYPGTYPSPAYPTSAYSAGAEVHAPTSEIASTQNHCGFSDTTARALGSSTVDPSFPPSLDVIPPSLAPPMEYDSSSSSASTTLLGYLNAPMQAINLVETMTYPSNRVNPAHFWWDVRNIRQWSSFSLEAMSAIPRFPQLLTTGVSQNCLPLSTVAPSRLYPDSEFSLTDLIRDVYAPRVNAALRISQGRDCLSLFPAPINPANRDNDPHFLANYASDTEQTPSGLPRGRIVGIVKTFNRWNTGMRNEAPHRRVEYLNGLSHLQRCMREHSCRYGFIMTEIELVCVRAGCDEGDDVPYFGFLELATPIATKTPYNPSLSSIGLSRSSSASSAQSSNYSTSSRGTSPFPTGFSGPFSATMALYYLLMLSKSVPLPTQPSWHLNVGGPGALTRQRTLPEDKDSWIPEPQQREKREAKRIRGWVWPHDAWHRREGGGSSRTRAAKIAAAKRWHK
ncbi:hypothetical protein H112_07742 [Trichophyton rubrum D6]|uniref:Sialidase n=5 Tax=Trichophyton TaxID=5550 RepID=A0A178ETX5_TRIRU|nr:uncharacterized protein TERG_00340 [Trichophyton rubrum CBS 118892]EZF48524.1 hypothetical protein H103_07754 [Trichophyton rubrum CBS 288.86]EZF69930.1 hypothetical protein H105_07758 [Trichophyton soudanense CBS 452.61]EZF80553.1 hypothetical protein H110_07752 [Trichophyton rubrum MR1448]EZF91245.1 hypothetical protein H113_07812 [Trichophyton rubrum MR1459]EZG02381.1 hypothetical protein H106_07589 [Trichophyton rubrum CBS 735.88]KDB29730.1 hypothetical protein H112_07742 [Trichophyton